MTPTRIPISRLLSSLVGLALVLASIPTMAAPASAAVDKPNLLGFVTEDRVNEIPQFEQQAKKTPAIYQFYWTVEQDWAAPWLRALLTQVHELGMVPYIEVTTPNPENLVSGASDSQLALMGDTIADWLAADPSRHILIAPLPEMNLKHHIWGGKPNVYKTGYQKIRNAFVDRGLDGSRIRFLFAPNGVGNFGDYDDYYPGDAIVDIIGFAKINRGDPWHDYQSAFQMHLDDLKSQVSRAKPIMITQTASVNDGGGRAQWLADMFTGLKADDQVIGAVYFNRLKDHDYRVLVNGQLEQAFINGYDNWSDPSEVSWIFDGRMDSWVAEREDRFGSGFTDTAGHTHENGIKWLAEQEITSGCNPPTNSMFCPDDPVTRGQMAVFLARALNLSAEDADHFSDDQGAFYESAANRLYEAEITSGCDIDRYCGSDLVSRGQMAALLARTLSLPPTSEDLFIDDDDSIFESGINKIARADITVGCNPPTNDRFCPGDPVTRGQMATFLKRALTG